MRAPFSIQYEELRIPELPDGSPQGLADFLDAVALGCQGKPVLIRESACTTTQFAEAFWTLYTLSEEVILETHSRQLVLLFTHNEEPALRPEGVSMSLYDHMKELRATSTSIDDVLISPTELHVDLSNLAPSVNEHGGDTLQEAWAFIENVRAQFIPAHALHVNGKIPLTCLSCALQIALPMSRTLYYHESDRVIRIK